MNPKVIVYRDGMPSPPLEKLQEMVGGFIEMIPMGDRQLIVNEAGKPFGLKVNPEATRWAQREGAISGADGSAGTAGLLDGEARIR